jgi:hypothetical protein
MRVESLVGELAGIGGLIEAAAVADDAEAFVPHQMRKAAFPILIREAKARTICEKVERLEARLEELEHLRQAALREEKEVPAAMPGSETAPMLRHLKLSSISTQATRIGRDLDQTRQVLEGLRQKVKPAI